MELVSIIEKHKIIQSHILAFLDDEHNNIFDLDYFFEISGKDFLLNQENLQTILCFLAKISNNHKRTCHFFSKIEQIILSFKDNIIKHFSSSEIVKIFQRSKRLILFFYKEKMIKIEDFVGKSIKFGYSQYFLPEIQSQLKTLLRKDEIFDEVSNRFAEFYCYKIHEIILSKFNFLKILNSDIFGLCSDIISSFNSFSSEKIESQIENIIKYLIFYNENWHFSIDSEITKNHQNEDKNENSEIDVKQVKKLSNNYIYRSIINELKSIHGEDVFLSELKEKKYQYEKKIFNERIDKVYEYFHSEMERLFDKEHKVNKDKFYKMMLSFVDSIPDMIREDYFSHDKGIEIDTKIFNDKSNILYQKVYSKIIKFTDIISNNTSNGKFIKYLRIRNIISNFIDDLIESEIEIEFDRLFEFLIKTFDEMNEKIKINDINLFELNRLNGENESYICRLIRNDSVVEFITHSNQSNLSLLDTNISHSIFETNSFLIKNKKTSLIEYAAFYGSIQIFQYLKNSNIQLLPSLWQFAIHGKNPELVHILEENKIKPESNNFQICLVESIKCHHNDFANYFIDNYDQNNDNYKQTNDNYNQTNDNYNQTNDNYNQTNDNYNQTNDNYNQTNDDYNQTNDNEIIDIRNLLKKLQFDSISFFSSRINLYVESNESYKNSIDFNVKMRKNLIKNIEISSARAYNFEFFPKDLASSHYIIYYLCRYNYFTFIEKIVESNKDRIDVFKQEHFKELKFGIRIAAIKGNSKIVQILLNSLFSLVPQSFFSDCFLKEIVIPSSIKKIDRNAFEKCVLLKKIVIPSSVTSIEEGAFKGCSSLTKISIPSSRTSIGESAFEGCPLIIEY